MKLKDYYKKGKFRNQAELARFLGVHESQICRWFNGEREISKRAALNIVKKTGGKVTLMEMLMEEG